MTDIPDDVVEMAAREIYDRRNGVGAFDQEKAIRLMEGIRWPSASFESVFAEARAAGRVFVEWERDRNAQKIAALERLVDALQQKWPTSAAMDHFHK
jgi:hypothetical protein